MISLTRLNSDEVVVNASHIVTVEASPDTVLTLSGGEKLRVRESPQQVVDRVIVYLQKVGSIPMLVHPASQVRAG